MDAVELGEIADASLVGRAVDGDVRAFEALVRRYARPLRAYARRLMGSDAEVDDIVQEAFVTAWQRMADLDDPAAVRSWLHRMVAHRSMDRLRARRDATTLEGFDRESPASERPERVAEARSATAALRRALDRMPSDQRRCWVMREMGGAGYDEIAAELALPVSTVRGMLSRARRRLAEEMEEWR